MAEKIIAENGLVYQNATIKDIVNNDADGDGIPDWEENLWGTDPTKKETNPGIPDSSAIAKLKSSDNPSTLSNGGNSSDAPENLTQTDKFARELFATVTATTQSGSLDQTTADQISASLADKIRNTPQRKVFVITDIKITKNTGVSSAKKFNDSLTAIYNKYPVNGNILGILQKFVGDGNNPDSSVLTGLNPIILQMNARMSAMQKIDVPNNFSSLYLDLLNVGERILENITDLRSYDSDPVVALGGIGRYEENVTSLGQAVDNFQSAINASLSN